MVRGGGLSSLQEGGDPELRTEEAGRDQNSLGGPGPHILPQRAISPPPGPHSTPSPQLCHLACTPRLDPGVQGSQDIPWTGSFLPELTAQSSSLPARHLLSLAHCNSVTSKQPTGSECNFPIELCEILQGRRRNYLKPVKTKATSWLCILTF